jgi:hypothetical protein
MIRFDSFIQSLQKAVTDASDVVNKKNLEIFDLYFTDGEAESVLRNSLDDALEHVNKMLDAKGRTNASVLQNAMKAFKAAKESLEGGGLSDEKSITPKSLKPVTITVQFPENTASGVVMRDVAIPLITLVPIRMPSIEEVRFKSNFNFQLVDDDIQIEFGANKGHQLDAFDANTDGSMEIVLRPAESTDGLRKLIEGYEKALRAQIPG